MPDYELEMFAQVIKTGMETLSMSAVAAEARTAPLQVKKNFNPIAPNRGYSPVIADPMAFAMAGRESVRLGA
ncbi:MAG: hypothetical protein K9G62_01280 [Alphaproteobacteria bacterium]|nr:hypothetical protein [Alphaproteobacteria bacterium]